MITYGDVRQAAGLFEGEGSFIAQGGSITLKLSMADRDVIEQARIWLGHTDFITSLGRVGRVNEYKPKRGRLMYSFTFHGPRAAGWMMMLYQFMGSRRRGQIREALGRWRVSDLAKAMRTHCPKGHPLTGVKARGRYCLICNRERCHVAYRKRVALRVINGAH